MKKRSANLVFTALTLLLLSLPFHGSLFAGDEEMLSPYMEFDPETGFFIPIDEPAETDTQTSTHAAQQNAQEVEAEIPDELPLERQSVKQTWLISAGIIIMLGGIIWLRLTRKK